MAFDPRRYFATAASDLRRHAADVEKLADPSLFDGDRRPEAAVALIRDAAALLDEMAAGSPSNVRRAS